VNKSTSLTLADSGGAVLTALMLVFGLFLVWPLPAVVALRHGLILALLGWTVLAARPLGLQAFRGWRMFAPLLLLTLWLLLHTTFINPHPHAAWGELWGQWFRALLVLLAGYGLGKVLSQGGSDGQVEVLIRVVLSAILVFALLIVGKVAYLYLHDGHFTLAQQLGRDRASFSLSVGMAILASDVIHRLMRREPLLGWHTPVVFGLTAFMIVAMVLAGARNGLIGMFFLFGSAICLWFSGHTAKREALLRLLPFVLLMALLAWVAIKSDARWQKFADTVPIALDTEHYRAWLTRTDYPHLPDGQVVDDSAYERIAWMKMGLELAIHYYPLGYGYERWVFGQALLPIYHGTAGGHSHSGYVDLLLSVGFPGLLLWLTFVAGVLVFAVRNYRRAHSPLALLLFFLVMSFNGRMVLDSVWRDHYLQTHFFLVAFLVACLQQQKHQG
jgi:hypothetical protein